MTAIVAASSSGRRRAPGAAIVEGSLGQEDRYPSVATLEADLRAGLAALGAPYGATEALEEGRNSRDGASMNRRVIGPTSENELPPAMVTTEDIITEPGGPK